MRDSFSRRDFLCHTAILTCSSLMLTGCGTELAAAPDESAPPSPPSPTPLPPGPPPTAGTTVWKPLRVGAGGFVTGIDIAPDGTKVIRTDTSNGYIWDAASAEWRPLFTASSLPATDFAQGVPVPNQYETNLSDGTGCYEARVAYSNSAIIYACFNAYVYKSTNRGASFVRTGLPAKQLRPNTGAQRLWGPKMAVDPANPDHVIIGTETEGLWRSVDGGTNWARVAGVPTATTSGLPLLVTFDPASGVSGGRTRGLYVSSHGNGVYRSTDGGSNWALTPNSPTIAKRICCDQVGRLYAIEDGVSGSIKRFDGAAWSVIQTPALGWHTIAVDPAASDRLVLLSDDGIPVRSNDGGRTWEGPWYSAYPAPIGYSVNASDIPWLGYQTDLTAGEIRFDPSASNKLYYAMGVGVLWTNFPDTFVRFDWTSQSKGIEQLVGEWIVSPPGGDPLVLAWDRPVFKIGNPDAFPSRYGPVVELHHGWDADYAPEDPSFVAGLFNYAGKYHEGYSVDGGANWTRFPARPVQTFGGCIAVGGRDNIVIMPSNNARAVYTTDRGATWNPVNFAGLPASGESGWGWAYYLNRKIVCADKVQPGTFYAYNYLGGIQGVWRSTDGGRNWARVFAGEIATQSTFNAKMRSVPGKAGHLFFTSGPTHGANPGDTLFKRSVDGGVTWTEVTNGGTSGSVKEVHCFGFGKSAPGQSYPAIFIVGYVNGNYGIFRSDDNCSNWVRISEYPNGNIDSINCIEGDLRHYGRVHVGFAGSGFAYGALAG